MTGRAAGAALLLLGATLAAPVAAARPGGGERDAGRAAAPAEVVDIGPAHLDVAAGWRVTAGAAGSPIVLGGPGDAVLIVTRMPAPNLPAWSRETRDAHVAALIAGFTAVDGATVARQAVTTDGPSGVPVLELALARAGRPVAIRVLLFRTLTVVAAATAERDAPAVRASLARAAAGLHPDR